MLNKLRLRESWWGTGLGLLTNRDSVESWRKTWTGLGLSNSKSWRWTGLGLTCDWESSCRESSWWLTSNGSSISGKPWCLRLARGRASGSDRTRRSNSWEGLEEKALKVKETALGAASDVEKTALQLKTNALRVFQNLHQFMAKIGRKLHSI